MGHWHPWLSHSSWDTGFLVIIYGARAAFSSLWRSLFCSRELQRWNPESCAASGCCNVNSVGFWHLHSAKHGSFSSQWLGQSLSIALPLCPLEFCFRFKVQAHPNLWGEMSSIESSMKEDTTRISSSLGLCSLEMCMKLRNWRLVHVFNNIVNKNRNQNICYLSTRDTGIDVNASLKIFKAPWFLHSEDPGESSSWTAWLLWLFLLSWSCFQHFFF